MSSVLSRRAAISAALSALAVAAFRPAPLAAQDLAPAPYVAPAVGTRYVYRNFLNVVTRSDGWRTYFTDQAGRQGLRTGLFIPDNPRSPLALETTDLARMWPLRVGKTTKIPARRGPLQWRWEVTVVGTEKVAVPAGKFDTYVVRAVEYPVVTDRQQASVNYTTFWYAPALNAVVRFKSGQLVGPQRANPIRQELVRIEQTGRSQ